ncbi:hypothetical protein BASA81_001833 [Batrachochytrium salamandrivorans]|nr:hypothetical protein BASA81_001833 [Batrachochytrium salamandrivorans]
MLSILAGCYDGTLHGWQTETQEVMDVELAFAFRAHDQCVRSIAVSGKLACTASTDESIQTYDLTKRKVSDRMMGVHHDEVTALSFSQSRGGQTFLLSGDREGRIYVWQVSQSGSDCQIIHELKGHKQDSPVTSISVHPSGKIALSTAKDSSLRMWDLSTGKAAPRTKLEDFGELGLVCWSPVDGARYGLVGNDSTVLVFDTLSGSETPIGVFKHPKRVNSLCFCEDVVLASACDDGALRTIGADGSLLREFRPTLAKGANSNLIRARDCKSAIVGGQVLLIGAFSDNTIRIWDVAGEDDEEELKILHVGSRSHITCIGVYADDGSNAVAQEEEKTVVAKKTKRAKLEVNESDDDENFLSEEEEKSKSKPKQQQQQTKKPDNKETKPAAGGKAAGKTKPAAGKTKEAGKKPKDDIIYVKQDKPTSNATSPIPVISSTPKTNNNKNKKRKAT